MNKKEAAQKLLRERSQKKRFTVPEGETTFRLLPNARGVDKAEYESYGMHSNVGPRKSYVRCGKRDGGKGTCWLCDKKLPDLANSKSSVKRKMSEDMARKECFAVQIAVKEAEGWAGPKLWEMPNSVANKLLSILTRRDELADPVKGYNLTITRTGTTMTTTRYGDLDRDDEASKAPKDVLARLKPFEDVIRRYDEPAMKAAYYGHEQDEEEGQEASQDDDASNTDASSTDSSNTDASSTDDASDTTTDASNTDASDTGDSSDVSTDDSSDITVDDPSDIDVEDSEDEPVHKHGKKQSRHEDSSDTDDADVPELVEEDAEETEDAEEEEKPKPVVKKGKAVAAKGKR